MILGSSNREQIRATLSRLIAEETEGVSVEIEARFGIFTGRNFQSIVDRNVFTRIRNFAIQLVPQYNYVHSKDRIYREDLPQATERYTQVFDEDGLVSQEYRLIKSKIQTFDIRDYFTRIAISTESVDYESAPETTPIYIREKKRWTFPFANQFSFDLTEVTTYRPEQKDPRTAETIYEIEIEIESDKLTGIDRFDQIIGVILQEFLNTQILYSQTELTNLIQNTNNYLGSLVQNPYKFDHRILNQARNLKMRDLVFGGIVPSTKHGVNYTVTPKADGFRKLLVVDSHGIYLVSPPRDVNKILDESVSQRISSWIGTVIEGELIPKTNLSEHAGSEFENVKYYFLMYDILSIAQDYRIRQRDHRTRLEYIQKFSQLFNKIPSFKFVVKPFEHFQTREEFYNKVGKVLDQNWPFQTDGLVFTPNNYQYDTDLFGTKTIDERNLTKYPDLVKWKPAELMTIDFEILHTSSPDGNYVELLSGSEGGTTPFTGDSMNSFDPRVNVLRNDLLANSPSGSIIEFKWRPEFEDSDPPVPGQFEAIRIRDDKFRPNTLQVALDVWKDIHSPIDEEILRGQKFGLVFRYHNRIKRELFLEVGRSLPKVNGIDVKTRTLLDIGSGKGGDVYKWVAGGFTHVICVEPDEDNRIELERRLKQTRLQFKIVPTVGQDIQRIYQAVQEFAPFKAVEAISYMLSLSFFFDDPQSSSSILNLANAVLMKGGYFLAFTIDGRHVLEFFGNGALYSMDNDVRKANFRMIDFELRPANSEIKTTHIYIDIPGSIVQEQTEYLTNLPGLYSLLESIGLKLLNEKRADQESFMTPEELYFTRLYTSFILQRV